MRRLNVNTMLRSNGSNLSSLRIVINITLKIVFSFLQKCIPHSEMQFISRSDLEAIPYRACIAVGDRLYVIGGQEGDFMAKPGSPIFKCSRRFEVYVAIVFI